MIVFSRLTSLKKFAIAAAILAHYYMNSKSLDQELLAFLCR
jgi:hypothetical protein